MAIKHLNTAPGHGIAYECDTMIEANGIKGNLYPGQRLIAAGDGFVVTERSGLRLSEPLVQNDGWVFSPSKTALVDAEAGNDNTAEVGSGVFKTIEAAGAAAYAKSQADPRSHYAVYVKAYNGTYLWSGNNGLYTFPNVHYCFEKKAIVEFDAAGQSSFKQFSDKTYGQGKYYIHGEGEFYQQASNTLVVPSFTFVYSSEVYIEADVIQFFGMTEDISIGTVNPRATGTLKVKKMLQTPHFQSNPSKDLCGPNLDIIGCDLLGGFKMGNAWQGRTNLNFIRCTFRVSAEYGDPSTAAYNITLKDGTVYRTIDLTATSNRWGVLADLASLGSVQAAADAAFADYGRVAAVEVTINGSSYAHNFTFDNCKFDIGVANGLGVKIFATTANDDPVPSLFKFINPQFIDSSGGTTGAISAWYSAGAGTAKIELILPRNGCDVYQQAHTSNPSYTLV